MMHHSSNMKCVFEMVTPDNSTASFTHVISVIGRMQFALYWLTLILPWLNY